MEITNFQLLKMNGIYNNIILALEHQKLMK